MLNKLKDYRNVTALFLLVFLIPLGIAYMFIFSITGLYAFLNDGITIGSIIRDLSPTMVTLIKLLHIFWFIGAIQLTDDINSHIK